MSSHTEPAGALFVATVVTQLADRFELLLDDGTRQTILASLSADARQLERGQRVLVDMTTTPPVVTVAAMPLAIHGALLDD
ncbi:hypothetical protein ACTQ49_13985 [Luteococcus sp. Sow4_B9]|uniref:hypothetical protein n=1 Tax=Luteococcus sp. Sow4_B9 TaxID=3438792 RepID=UPI003F989BE2